MNLTLFDKHDRIKRSAELSEDGRYRWWLRRELPGGDGRVVTFVMLNPSTADALQDDRTICRCMGFVRSWGCSVLSVRNLFCLRATHPIELRTAVDPIGGQRGMSELAAAFTADIVVAAWGANVSFGRDEEALAHYARGKPIWCLRLTKYGKPWHPLYVPADTIPIPFRNCTGEWPQK